MKKDILIKKVISCVVVAMMAFTTTFVPVSALADDTVTNDSQPNNLSVPSDVASSQPLKETDLAGETDGGNKENAGESNPVDATNSSNLSELTSDKKQENPSDEENQASGEALDLKDKAGALSTPSTQPTILKAPAATWGTITFEKSAGNKPNEVVAFTSADQTLGTRGLYDTGSSYFKRYFIGWSPNKNWKGNGSEIFFSTSTIGDVFPDGFVGNKTLYAIYVGLIELGTISQTGKLGIASDVLAESIVPDSALKESDGFGSEGEKTATFYYDANQAENKLVLNASFTFNEYLGIITYLNPGNIFVNSGTWSDGAKQGARYSHADLHFTLDERVNVADEVTLSFTSYSFKPEYILDENYQVLKSGLSSSVVTNSPTSTFSFNPGDNRSFILRTTIRHDGNAKNALVGTPEQVLSPSVLASASDANFSVSLDVARAIALNKAQPLVFTGYIDGVSKVSILTRSIPKVEASPVYVGFAGDQVTFMDDNNQVGQVKVVHGASISTDDFISETMPQDPTKADHVFTGWNTAPDGSGTQFTGDTLVTGTTVVYAQWTPLVFHNVTFINDSEVFHTTRVENGKTIATSATAQALWPANPIKSGFTFIGWNTALDGSGSAFTDQSVVEANTTLYAQWKQDGAVAPVNPVAPGASADPVDTSQSGADVSKQVSQDVSPAAKPLDTANNDSPIKTGDAIAEGILILLAVLAAVSAVLFAYSVRRCKS